MSAWLKLSFSCPHVAASRHVFHDHAVGTMAGDGPQDDVADVLLAPGQRPAMTVIVCTPARHELCCPCTT
jgi:uncharacterized cupredoxin-like copper-binding protein